MKLAIPVIHHLENLRHGSLRSRLHPVPALESGFVHGAIGPAQQRGHGLALAVDRGAHADGDGGQGPGLSGEPDGMASVRHECHDWQIMTFALDGSWPEGSAGRGRGKASRPLGGMSWTPHEHEDIVLDDFADGIPTDERRQRALRGLEDIDDDLSI